MRARKDKILIFIDWFLPGTNSGGPVRSIANMVEHFEDVCDFYVVTRNHDYCSTEVYELETNSWHHLKENLFVKYLSSDSLNINTYRTIFLEFEFKSVYINGIYSLKFSILPVIALKKFNSRLIIGARGMLNPQAFSVKRRKKRFYLFISNLFNFYEGVAFHATNVEEAKNIRNQLSKDIMIYVAPNFPRKYLNIKNHLSRKISGELKLVNLARISPEKGTLYGITLLQDLKDYKVCMDIYGSIYDHNYWETCKSEINKLPSNITVNYKGELDGGRVPGVLEKYQFFMMPSKGENFGHSILEALSAGLPVIISSNTPWQHLKAQKVGWDISLDRNDEFKKALNQAAEMGEYEYSKWSENARYFAEKIINDPKTLKANELMLGVST